MKISIPKFGTLGAVAAAVAIVGNFGLRKADAAFLLGQQVTLEVASPTHTSIVSSWGPLTVGAGPEVTAQSVFNVVNFIADISDESITFSYPNGNLFNNPAFNGYVLQEDSVTLPPFTYAAVDPSTTLAGFTNSRVSFDATHVYMNVEGLSVAPGQQLVVDFAPVPEPASLSLLAIVGIPLLLRRRRSTP